MNDENPLPRTDLPDLTPEEEAEIAARPRDEQGHIRVTLEEVLRFPKDSVSGWRLLPRDEKK